MFFVEKFRQIGGIDFVRTKLYNPVKPKDYEVMKLYKPPGVVNK